MHRDYAPKGVKFFYIYKYLAHAGAKGYVQPFTLKERLLHIKEAKRTLGTEISWICDTMTNDLKHSLGDAPTSEFVIDPEGKIVRRRAWGNAKQLRKDLEELVGPVEHPTKPADLKLKTEPPPKVAPRGIVKRIKRPGGMKPLRIVPEIKPDDQPFYVKLRPQADRQLLRTGAGKLFLDFRLDPIYHVHWNNLTKPIRIELESAGETTLKQVGRIANPSGDADDTQDGLAICPTKFVAEGPKVEQPSDIDPREFLIEVNKWNYQKPIRLTVHYFACNDEQGWCKSISQRYVIHLSEDVEDGYYVKTMSHFGVWPSFRGPSGDGISTARNVPLTWGPDNNIKWRAELPEPGDSSPIVSGDRVFITCAEDQGRKRSLYCFNRSDGKQLWVQTVEFDKVMPTHKTNPYCASTPLAVGHRVVVWHGSAGLFCYDHDGKELWSRDLGEFRHMWGYASSPVFYKDRIILNCGPGKRTFLTAIELTTGKTLWQTDEPIGGDGDRNENGKYSGSWSTPVIARVGGKDQIICSLTTRVNGYDPDTGEILWTCDGLRGRKGDLAYSSPVIAGDTCVVLGGFNGPSFGFKLGGSGNITDAGRLWRVERNPQNIGSGVFVGRHVYVPDAGPGTLRCIEPETGKVLWRERIPGGGAWGSIVYADGRGYVTCKNGDTVVFAPSSQGYKELAVNSLGEPSNSTPAIADGEIFVRTFNALYCISAGGAAGNSLSEESKEVIHSDVDPTTEAPASDKSRSKKAAPSKTGAASIRLKQSDLDPFFRPPAEYADDFGDYRSPLKFYDGRAVKTAEDWQSRRREILDRWHKIMGPWPPLIEKPKIDYLKKERRENFTQYRVRVEMAPGLTHPAILLVPDGKGPFPAAVVPFYWAETGAGLPREPNQPRPTKAVFGYQLTKRGFVTLSLGFPSSLYYPSKERLQLQPLSALAYVAANCHTALAGLSYVDADRIGIVGHSYGGKWAMFASCLYDKFACAAWSDGGIVFDEQRGNVNYWEPWYLGYETDKKQRPAGIPNTDNPRTGAYKTLVEQGLDLHELHALMAPRPFLVSGGAEDRLKRWRPLNHAVAVNKLLGYTNRVAMTNRKRHSPTPESNEQIYLFFERFLKSKREP